MLTRKHLPTPNKLEIMNILKKSNFPIFVILLSVVFMVYPVPALAYHDGVGDTRYAVAHESTEAYDEVSKWPLDVDSPTPVSNLSPASQQVFIEAKEQPLDTGSETRAAGWQPHRDVKICRPNLLVCDGVPEPPAFPHHGSGAYGFGGYGTIGWVEYEDEAYLVRVNFDEWGPRPFFDALFDFILKTIILGPYTLFLGLTVRSQRFQQKYKFGFAGIGFALVAGVFSLPYIHMFMGGFLSRLSLLSLVGGPWVVMIGGRVLFYDKWGHQKK